MKIDISIALLAILLGAAATVSATPNGDPFREIWESIEDLQQQINDGIGTLSVNERSQTFECPPGSRCTYYVSCQSDEVLTGGGFQLLNDPVIGDIRLWQSAPDIGQNRWHVTFGNSPMSITTNITVYAMCGKIS